MARAKQTDGDALEAGTLARRGGPGSRSPEGATQGTVAAVLRLQSQCGNRALTELVQRTLDSETTTYATEADLQLPPGRPPSPVVAGLVRSPKKYYLPDGPPPNFEAPAVKALEASKFLLGEDHGDGTWAARTRPWGRITKMREGLKGFRGLNPQENAAISAAGVTPTNQGVPLEDMHAYALTKIVSTQQILNGFNDLMLDPVGQKLVEGHLTEVATILGQYAKVGLQWFKASGQPAARSRAEHFMLVGFGIVHRDAWKTLESLALNQKAVSTISPKELGEIQQLLTEEMGHLTELIDTRPTGGGVWGFFQSKQGPDPIANRAALTSLGKASPGAYDVAGFRKSIEEGNKLREAEMAKRIQAEAAPLLVQIGDNHVDSVAAAVGPEAVRVKKGIDFDALVTKR